MSLIAFEITPLIVVACLVVGQRFDIDECFDGDEAVVVEPMDLA